MRSIFVFEYPEDYWEMSKETRELINKWADTLFNNLKDNKIVMHGIPPKSKLYVLDILNGEEF